MFPLAAGAASVLIEKAGPNELVAAIERFRPTVLSPRRLPIARSSPRAGPPICRACGSASRPASRCRSATFEAWKAATGISLMDGIGSTEMLHIFIGSPPEEIRPGATGAAGSRL